jgi:hypothetical protein
MANRACCPPAEDGDASHIVDKENKYPGRRLALFYV